VLGSGDRVSHRPVGDIHRAERRIDRGALIGARTHMQSGQAFDKWMAALEARHLADLRFPEVARALRALSSTYVERRGRLAQGAALDGAGKRAAFALFYAPLHALVTLRIVEAIEARLLSRTTLVDLGCGTGGASGAWALTAGAPVSIEGV